jgi:hypothetical protein
VLSDRFSIDWPESLRILDLMELPVNDLNVSNPLRRLFRRSRREADEPANWCSPRLWICPWHTVRHVVSKCQGDFSTRAFSGLGQFLSMAFTKITIEKIFELPMFATDNCLMDAEANRHYSVRCPNRNQKSVVLFVVFVGLVSSPESVHLRATI